MKKVQIKFIMSKLIKEKKISLNQKVWIHPDSWTFVEKILIDQGWEIIIQK